MKYVYLMQGVRNLGERYVGVASDLERRLAEHNRGKCVHTSKHRPWRLVTAVRFEDDARARAFERYLKSGSGRAFANRHFW